MVAIMIVSNSATVYAQGSYTYLGRIEINLC